MAERALKVFEERVQAMDKLIVVPVPETALCQIKYDGKGGIPFLLQGFYTSERLAQKAIETYLSKFNPHG